MLDRQESKTFKFQDIMPAYKAGKITAAQATDAYQQCLTIDSVRPNALHYLGILAMEGKHFLDAIGLISQAIALVPDRPEYHHNLATLLRLSGNFEDAEHHYSRAIRLRPSYAEAYFNFADTRRFKADDEMVRMLETQLEQTQDQSDEDRCFLHFAAGKIYQDIKDYPRAFHHFRQGNQARKAQVDYQFDPKNHDDWVEQIMTVCDRPFFDAHFSPESLGQRVSDASPIFIVGMPRSGTTLTESILTRHPLVAGLGELPDIRSIAHSISEHAQGTTYPHSLKMVARGILNGFANAYLKRTKELAPKAKRTVDKLPANFFYLGLIALMFPKAKIIHCQRDPLDTCLSCYCKKFRSGQEFSFDLEHLGHYYLSYQRLTDHWNRVLPIPIFQMHYEQLVQDQEHVSRALLEFCGLSWTDACLSFNEDKRVVQTASSWQVRQPLYASSVKKWKCYEHELALLRDLLKC